ncbi:MFS transporter [Nocardia amamiensis]|uniref:MFS transporter n=2 Tax=Nocardia amamiensis TaxID=404578 RepID=A0ABS0CWX1_9NOCA|nr:MFS transporter [Nocardia amamiensis]
MRRPAVDVDALRAHAAAAHTPDPRRWLALVVMLVAGFMDLLDITIVNVAIPSMLQDLDAEYTQMEWVVAGYVLGFAALLITGGRLGDLYGRKRVFLVGVAGFTLASGLCGVAADPAVLIGSRVLQGAMAGLMVPQILAIVRVDFPADERGKALGIWGGVLGSASVAGLVLGGVLLQWDLFGWGWRPIFLINVPVGICALAGAWVLVRDSRSPAASRLDPIGVALATTAIVMVVYPLTEGRSLGWPAWTFVLMATGLVLLGVFVAYEGRRTRTAGSPLMALALFRARAFSTGMATWAIFWVALGGFFFMWMLYLQIGLGWTPLRSGLTATPFAVAAAAGSGLAVQVFVPRFGRRVLMAGALVNAAGFAGYSWVATHYGPGVAPWQMVIPLAVAGFGFGLVVAPMVDLILTGVPADDAGSASGTLSTVQQVGTALGIALVGVVFFTQFADDSGRGVDAVTPALHRQLTLDGVPAADRDAIIAQFRACVHDRSAATDPTQVPDSCRSRSGPPAATQRILTDAGLQANAHNFARTFGRTLWYGAGTMVAVFFGIFGLPRRMRRNRVHLER